MVRKGKSTLQICVIIIKKKTFIPAARSCPKAKLDRSQYIIFMSGT